MHAVAIASEGHIDIISTNTALPRRSDDLSGGVGESNAQIKIAHTITIANDATVVATGTVTNSVVNPSRRSAPGVAAQRSDQSACDPRASRTAFRRHGFADQPWGCSGISPLPPRRRSVAALRLQGARLVLGCPQPRPRPRSCCCARRQPMKQARAWSSSPCTRQRSGTHCSRSPCAADRPRLRAWPTGAGRRNRRDGASLSRRWRGPQRQHLC